MSFDIASLDTATRATAGVDMPVLHPRTKIPITDDDTGKQVTVKLYGRNSEQFRAAQRAANTRRQQFISRNITLTPEDYERERLEYLAACTAGWTFDVMDGQAFPFTPENVRRLWSDKRWEWLANDAWTFMVEDGNFLAL